MYWIPIKVQTTCDAHYAVWGWIHEQTGLDKVMFAITIIYSRTMKINDKATYLRVMTTLAKDNIGTWTKEKNDWMQVDMIGKITEKMTNWAFQEILFMRSTLIGSRYFKSYLNHSCSRIQRHQILQRCIYYHFESKVQREFVFMTCMQ